MKKLLLLLIMFTYTPVFADKVDCGIISEITRPAAHIIMIAAPILLLILGTIDFLGAVTANDERKMKKATDNFIKRLLICVVIMILPLLVNMIISFTTFKNLHSCL